MNNEVLFWLTFAFFISLIVITLGAALRLISLWQKEIREEKRQFLKECKDIHEECDRQIKDIEKQEEYNARPRIL